MMRSNKRDVLVINKKLFFILVFFIIYVEERKDIINKLEIRYKGFFMIIF